MKKHLGILCCLVLFGTLLLLAGCSARSGSGLEDGDFPVMTLPVSLNRFVTNMTGTLTVYDEDYNIAATAALRFVTNTAGETTVTSSAVTLNRSTFYHFILIFYVDGIPIAYAHLQETTAASSSTSISYSEDDIVYGSIEELLTGDADLSSDIIPDLDLDDDGFENFVEFAFDSDPSDANSVPAGPTISDFSTSTSADGNTLTISATLTHVLDVTAASVSFNGYPYLSNVLEESLDETSSSGTVVKTYTATINPQYFCGRDQQITLTATTSFHGVSVSSTDSLNISVAQNGSSVGPVIDFISPTDGTTVAGSVSVTVQAYDCNGIDSLSLTRPTGLSDSDSSSDVFTTTWDSTLAADGNQTFTASATNTSGATTQSSINVTVSNSTDDTAPTIEFVAANSAGTEIPTNRIYGVTSFTATANDASGVSSLTLDQFYSSFFYSTSSSINQSFSTVATYTNRLDTTTLDDGTSLTLTFTARDTTNHTTTQSFTLTVQNTPTLDSLTFDGTAILSDSQSFDLVGASLSKTLSWTTTQADTVSITRTRGASTTTVYSSSTNLDGSQTLDLATLGYGTYTLTAQVTTQDRSGTSHIYSVSRSFEINIDADADDAFNDDDCDDNNALAFPGSTTAYLGFDYNCDDDEQSIPLSDATITFTGSSAADQAGYALANAGDVNHDGIDDLLIAAPGTSKGNVYLIYGKTTLASIDLGSADVIFTGQNTGDHAGVSVAGNADVNHDGCADLLIGANYYDEGTHTNIGRTYLIYGRGTGCTTTTPLSGSVSLSSATALSTGTATNDYNGTSVAFAGDVNGDGNTDVIVGEYGSDNTGTDAGRAYIFTNVTSTAPTVTIDGTTSGDQFGFAVSGAGDVNGDGFDDFVIGAPVAGSGGLRYGKATLYFGAASLSTSGTSYVGGSANFMAGHSVAGVGDINNDGLDDVLIGVPAYHTANPKGRAALIVGDNALSVSSTLSTAYDFIGMSDGDTCGTTVGGVGDLNNDLNADMAISCYNNDLGASNAGAVAVYLNSASRFNGYAHDVDLGTADYLLTGESANQQIGTAFAGGDFNGDGQDDLLIGGQNSAQVYLILSHE